MNKFDYETQRAVGIMNINYGGNGYVEVCGYLDGGQFYPLDRDEAKEMFPPRGIIFAHYVTQKYQDFDGECISISVSPNQKEGEGYDEYVWNKSTDIELQGYILNKIDDLLGDNGEKNFRILTDNDLLNQEETVYILSGENIYKIENSESRCIPYFDAKKAHIAYSEKLERYYLLNTDLGEEKDVVDITNDNQLIEWFTKKILKPNWTTLKDGGKTEALNAIRETLLSYKQLALPIAESRYNRLSTLIGVYQLSKEGIDNLQNFPWIVPSIENSINNLKEEYIKEIEEKNLEKISNLKQEYESQIAKEKSELEEKLSALQEEFEQQKTTYDIKYEELDKQITAKKDELQEISTALKDKREAIKKEEERLESIRNRKDEIIKDFEVVRDVFNSARQGSIQEESIFDYSDDRSDKSYTIFSEFQTLLGCWMDVFGLESVKSTDISALLSKYKIVLLPNDDIIKSIIMATGKCTYLKVYVGVSWKSYKDLWESGLDKIIAECRKHDDRIHYLILRNINLSYIPNYLQPVLDIQSGFSNRLPNEKEEFPKNLRILATASSDKLIPMTQESLKHIGCVGKIEKNNSSSFKKEQLMDKGFLVSQMLNEISSEISVNNQFEEYLDEEQ